MSIESFLKGLGGLHCEPISRRQILYGSLVGAAGLLTAGSIPLRALAAAAVRETSPQATQPAKGKAKATPKAKSKTASVKHGMKAPKAAKKKGAKAR